MEESNNDIPYYSDGSLSAYLYDIVESCFRDSTEEISFYRSLAAQFVGKAEPSRTGAESSRTGDDADQPQSNLAILDVACGTARISLPLAAAGYHVDAIDLSAAMLEIAGKKRALEPPEVGRRLALHLADMRSFDLGRTYDLVIVPFRSFNFLLDSEAQQICLSNLRTHLSDTGHVLIDTIGPYDQEKETADPASATILLPGTNYKILWESKNYRAGDEALLTRKVQYSILNSAGAVLRKQTETLRIRYIHPDEFRHQLAIAGFKVVSVYGGFDRRPAEEKKDHLWLIAKNN